VDACAARACRSGTATTSLPAVCHRVPHGECDGANLSDADVTRANLEHAELNRGNLSGASPNDAYLFHSHVNGANMNYAHLEPRQLAQAGFARGRESDMVVRCSPVGGPG